jgi:hypothetical protein
MCSRVIEELITVVGCYFPFCWGRVCNCISCWLVVRADDGCLAVLLVSIDSKAVWHNFFFTIMLVVCLLASSSIIHSFVWHNIIVISFYHLLLEQCESLLWCGYCSATKITTYVFRDVL